MTNNHLEQLARQSMQERLTDAHDRSRAAQCRDRRHPVACYLAGVLHTIADWLDNRSQAAARPAR